MFHLLETAVNIDSGSTDKAGVDRVGVVFRDFLQRAGIEIHVSPLADHGDCLMGTVPADGKGFEAPVLLLGHMDTVFPRDTVAQRPYRTDGRMAYGPGVACHRPA